MSEISVGVDIGGTKTLAVVYSDTAGIIARHEIATNRYAAPGVLLPEVVSLAREVIARAGLTIEELAGIGVGVPGLVSRDRIFIDSIILPAWFSVDVQSYLAEALKVSVVIVDNDATMAAVGHWWTCGHPALETLLCLTLGTGVGAAVLVNSKAVRGPDGTAGQLGHMTIELSGRPCSCGSVGCLNAYVSGTAIAERYSEQADQARTGEAKPTVPVNARFVLSAAERGDRIARQVLSETSTQLGAGLASLVNIFNPDVVLIAGGVSEFGERLLPSATAVMRERSFRDSAQRVRVERARSGVAIGAVGAALAVWHQA